MFLRIVFFFQYQSFQPHGNFPLSLQHGCFVQFCKSCLFSFGKVNLKLIKKPFSIDLTKKKREQSLGLFFAGGAFSSLTSHLFKLAIRDYRPSLGASGGVFAFVACSTMLDPHAKVSFIFLPWVPFEAQTLIPFVALFDVIGLIGVLTKRWTFGFDHAAHLGGLIFGILYTQYILKGKKRRSTPKQNFFYNDAKKKLQ